MWSLLSDVSVHLFVTLLQSVTAAKQTELFFWNGYHNWDSAIVFLWG